jgi:DNA-binding NarL/FixJ family response regulator
MKYQYLFMNKIKLLIADDHPVVRDGIKSILAGNPAISVVGEAGSGDELVEKCGMLQPDVVLTDVVMKEGIDGEKATAIITDQYPLVNVVAMSMYERYHDINRMFDAGAIGYISKNAEKEEYIEAIECASRNQLFYCKRIRKRLQAAGPNMKRLYNAVQFNERELQVLALLCKGHDNARVSEALELSIRTIEGYRLKLLEKFNTKNIVQVIVYAIATGWVKVDEME